MNETLEYLGAFARLPFSLRPFLRRRLTLGEARTTIRQRLERREENFVRLLERRVYGHPGSPYLALLRAAGCELGDVRSLARREGVEGALRELRRAGVYVTFEEFKGRKPIERLGLTLTVTPRDFDNPDTRRVFSLHTGGSTGAAMSVGVGIDNIAARAPSEVAFYAAHGLLHVPTIKWSGRLPGFALRNILLDAQFGRPLARWYSPTGVRDSRYWIKYGLATYYVITWLRLHGLQVPWPVTVYPDQALAVARGVAEAVDQHGRCTINSSVSHVMRVCLAAQDAGIDLTGAMFVGSSEPATPAKVRRILASGAAFTSTYGMVEAGRIGVGCARPDQRDDVHLVKDVYALFTYPYEVSGFGVTVPAFNLTALLPTSAKVVINLQVDDYGILEERHCGCELESCGYATHIRDIRSYSKLTGEGVTLIGSEIVHVLEDVLPERFGGSPLDYQLLEQEDRDGFTRLYLVISPRLEIADEKQVTDVVLRALRESSSMADAVRTVWQRTHTLQVLRREPVVVGRGKQHPLRFLSRSEGPE